jgi:hypothetical protein
MKYVVGIMALLLSTSVEAGEKAPPPAMTPEPNGAEMISRGEESLRSALLDPEGARIKWDTKPYWTKWKEGGAGMFNKTRWGWVVCGRMNAKTRLGGYTGEERVFIYLRSDDKFRTGMAWDLDGACGPEDVVPDAGRLTP